MKSYCGGAGSAINIPSFESLTSTFCMILRRDIHYWILYNAGLGYGFILGSIFRKYAPEARCILHVLNQQQLDRTWL